MVWKSALENVTQQGVTLGKEKQYCAKKLVQLDEIRRPLLESPRCQESRKRSISDYKKLFKTRESIPLRDLEQGLYVVLAARKQATRFGDSYKLLVVFFVFFSRRNVTAREQGKSQRKGQRKTPEIRWPSRHKINRTEIPLLPIGNA